MPGLKGLRSLGRGGVVTHGLPAQFCPPSRGMRGAPQLLSWHWAVGQCWYLHCTVWRAVPVPSHGHSTVPSQELPSAGFLPVPWAVGAQAVISQCFSVGNPHLVGFLLHWVAVGTG